MVAILVQEIFKIIIGIPLVLFNLLINKFISYPITGIISLIIISGIDTKILNIYINLFTYLVELISIYVVIGIQIIYLFKNIIRVHRSRIIRVIQLCKSIVNQIIRFIRNHKNIIKLIITIIFNSIILVYIYYIKSIKNNINNITHSQE